MSKFGFDPMGEPAANNANAFAQKLANFPPSAPRSPINLSEVDAAAAPHGFVSREPRVGRKRRTLASEPKRHFSFMMPASQYDRFIAYADRHRLTYHEAISRLLDGAAD
jgi:hypothetical protein